MAGTKPGDDELRVREESMSIEFHRDGPWELPEGWVWARLGDTCQINRPPSFDDLPDGFEIPFLPMAAVAEETGAVDFSQRRPISEIRSGYTRFRSGDVIFAKITPCMENGKSAALLDMPIGLGAGSTEFHTLRSQALEPRYLWYWLLRKAFRADAQRNMRGAVGQLRVPVDYLADAQIAIPPLPEQRRIVARIDELFTEIADGEAALARARDDLETWRRALLKAAVTGELTKDWREANKPNESGSDVVKHAAELKGRFGVRSNRNRTIPTDTSELPDLPEVPSGWLWAKLSDFAWASSYGTSTKCAYDAPGAAVLRIPNIRAGKIDLHDLKRATTTLDLADDDFLHVGDLLIVRTNGSEDLIGRAAIIGEALADKCYFASYLIRFRIVANLLLRKWIALHFETPIARTWIRKNIATSAGQYNISQSSLMRMPIPVPPTSEMTVRCRYSRNLSLHAKMSQRTRARLMAVRPPFVNPSSKPHSKADSSHRTPATSRRGGCWRVWADKRKQPGKRSEKASALAVSKTSLPGLTRQSMRQLRGLALTVRQRSVASAWMRGSSPRMTSK